ncbi:phosphotransferase [Viridibacillus soli]|uniref:phosphotransferase n=1 Tax=Viridibacillus soli TaxID=2798301 RepID=UPI002D7F4F76|nr:phosphotransferase [Viridibacillus soli]
MDGCLLSFLQMSASFYFPALQATLPLIVAEKDLLQLNGWDMNVATAARVTGTALAGLILVYSAIDTLYMLSLAAYIALLFYRILVESDTFYLRILPEQDYSFATEVKVHDTLINKGVKVPKVIHFEHKNHLTGLSLMIMDEMAGQGLSDCSNYMDIKNFENVIYDAGTQLALINQIPVDGFGWIDKNNPITLAGEHDSFKAYYHEHYENDLSLLSNYPFNIDEIKNIRDILETGFKLFDRKESYLVHGDFDPTHIFQENGYFTGIIDFGEIMGSSPLYDLGHFKLHDGESGNKKGFEALLRGYSEVKHLTFHEILEIDIWALFIGLRRLGMIYGRRWNFYHDHLIQTVKSQLTVLNKNI